ncbi:MAG: hypothetical protein ACOVMP_11975 [Chthoniobacterales bacterium]
MTTDTNPPFGTTECLAAFGGFVAISILLCVIALRPPATTQTPTITPIAVQWESPAPAPDAVDRLEFDPSTEPVQEP